MSAVIAIEPGTLRKVADELGNAAPELGQDHIDAAIAQACRKIAPLWPLKHFVAVNPFLGFSDRTFAATCATLRRVARVDMLMPRAFYRQALDAGLIEDRDLTATLAIAPRSGVTPPDVAALKLALAKDPASIPPPAPW